MNSNPIFLADSYFFIGQAHLTSGKPCQDYSIDGVHGRVAYAIVSDGCSSGRHTDVGARVLGLSTAKAIREHWTTTGNLLGERVPFEIGIRQQVAMSSFRETYGLVNEDMLATCIFAYLSPEGGFVHLQGDGVIAYKLRSGHICMFSYEWANNMPAYPIYANDDYEGYIKAQGGDVDAVALTMQSWEQVPEGEFADCGTREYTLAQGVRGITMPLSIDQIEYVAVFTDGVMQIEHRDWKEAVVECLSFKTTRGEFATRRMIRVIKDAKKEGKGPIDDIAVSVIKIEHPETEGEA